MPMTFGAIQAGTTADRTFTISNSGSSLISGNANVIAPFSIVSGGAYTLTPGQSQAVKVRYSPVTAGTHTAYVSFSGGGGATRQVMGSAFNNPTATTGTIAGKVTRSDTHAALNGVGITVVGPGANLFNGGSSLGTVSGNSAGQAGSYSISGLAPNAYYHVLATSSGQQFDLAELTGVSVVAGQTTTANIELVPVPPVSQPPTLTPEQTPVVLVRGTGENKTWSGGESGTWATMRTTLAGQGFQQIWDCNEPDNDPDFPVNGGLGQVINGEKSIEENSMNLVYYIEQKAQQFNRANGYYPATINIVAHSMGGLIARRAAAGGTFIFYDSHGKWVRIKVNKVVMLATPNAGSAIADLAVQPLLSNFFINFLLQSKLHWQPDWPATKDLTTHNVRDIFNGAYKWPSSVQLYLLGGGGGPNSSDFFGLRITGSALAGDQALSLPLPAINMFLPPEQINDGAVTWPSLQGNYYFRTLPFLQLQQITSVSFAPAVPPKFFANLDHSEILDAPEVAT
jgi:hypothetical protein